MALTYTKYGYAESSELKATNAGHIYSIVNASLPIENGTLWVKGDIVDSKDATEVYGVSKPAATSKVILALSPLYSHENYTKLSQHEMYLRKEAGEVARGYELDVDDRYAIASYMITCLDSTKKLPVAGNYLVFNTTDGATTEYLEVAKASFDADDYGFAVRVNAVVPKSNMTIIRLEVVKNEKVVASPGPSL